MKVQLREIFRAHRATKRRNYDGDALEVLRLVFSDDAERIANAYPHQLSGGQQQRVLIAQALACRPQFLFADELTASLDSCTQQEILRLIQGLVKKLQIGLLIVSHNAAILAGLADQILVMKDGRVVEYGTVREIFNSPKHAETKRLLSCIPTDPNPDPRVNSTVASEPREHSCLEEMEPFASGSSRGLRR